MTNPVTVRPAAPDEREALGELKLRSTLAWGDFVEELASLPEARELAAGLLPHTLVAVASRALVGFVTLLPPANGTAELEELFVDPAWWRRGVGRRLVEHAAARSGAATLHVECGRRAQGFYEALGFRVVGEVATRFEPALSMRRDA